MTILRYIALMLMGASITTVLYGLIELADCHFATIQLIAMASLGALFGFLEARKLGKKEG